MADSGKRGGGRGQGEGGRLKEPPAPELVAAAFRAELADAAAELRISTIATKRLLKAGKLEADPESDLDPVGGFYITRTSIDAYLAGAQKLLQLTVAKPRKPPAEPPVEPDIGFVRLHLEKLHASHQGCSPPAPRLSRSRFQ